MATHFLPESKYVLCTSTPNTHICAEFQDEVYDTRFSKMFCPNMPLQGQHTFCQLMSKSEHFTKQILDIHVNGNGIMLHVHQQLVFQAISSNQSGPLSIIHCQVTEESVTESLQLRLGSGYIRFIGL